MDVCHDMCVLSYGIQDKHDTRHTHVPPPLDHRYKTFLMKVILVKVMSEEGHIQRHNKILVCYDSSRMKAFIEVKDSY